MTDAYTSALGAGLGLINETQILLDIWQPGMDVSTLNGEALASGRFPSVSARRLRNIVREGFAPRFLRGGGLRAERLKKLSSLLTAREFEQLLFVYTARVHPILADFICQTYWPAYAAGRTMLSNEDALDFVIRANQEGKTSAPWSEAIVRRVAAYLTGCCADFGLLEQGSKGTRAILSYTILPNVAAIVAYELHEQGLGDSQLIHHPTWALFGLDSHDVVNELRKLALRGLIIVQTAGAAVRLSWPYSSWKEFISALAGS